MRLFSLIAHASRRLFRRPMRSFLLLQGTVWGIAVAVFPSAVIEGTREAARTRAAMLGADRIAVAPDPTAGEDRFQLVDLHAVEEALGEAGIPVEAAGGARVVEVWDDERSAALVLATPGAPEARGLRLRAGRWLRDDDPPDVCVVEAHVGAWLGRSDLGVGDAIRLPGRDESLRVVGILAARDTAVLRSNDLGFDVDHPMFAKLGQGLLLTLGIPFVRDGWKREDRTVWRPLGDADVDWIFLRVGATHVKAAADRASAVLVDRGRSPVTLHPLVLPFLLGDEVDRFHAVQYALFLACLAMGAVVMANLGFLTVLRRKREIAIRRVEGATQLDIVLQLLAEGVLLTTGGIGLGWLLAMGLARFRVMLEPTRGFTWAFPWSQALIAAAVALVVGILASLLPALRAGAQAPVEGLIDE